MNGRNGGADARANIHTSILLVVAVFLCVGEKGVCGSHKERREGGKEEGEKARGQHVIKETHKARSCALLLYIIIIRRRSIQYQKHFQVALQRTRSSSRRSRRSSAFLPLSYLTH